MLRRWNKTALSLLAIALAASMLLIPGSVAWAYLPPCPNGGGYYVNWRDVNRSDWFYEYVRQVSNKNIAWMSGWDFGWKQFVGYRQYFYPSDEIELMHWIGALNRAFGLSLSCKTGSITRAYAASDLIRAAGLGWVADQMSYSEASKILERFPDYRKTPSSVYRDVAVAVKYGIINGVTRDGNKPRLEPNEKLTRAQAATMLARIGLARASTNKTSYDYGETVYATGSYVGLDTIRIKSMRLHRDSGSVIYTWRAENVSFRPSDFGLVPGIYYITYEVATQRKEYNGQTVSNTWTSAPAVFEVRNNLPRATILAPVGHLKDLRPEIRVLLTDDDGHQIRGIDVEISTEPNFSSRNQVWDYQIDNINLASGTIWTRRPSMLSPGTYYIRARAYDGFAWGNWNVAEFTIADPNYLNIRLEPSPNPVRQYERLQVMVTLDTNLSSSEVDLITVTFNGRDVAMNRVGEFVWIGKIVVEEEDGFLYPLYARAASLNGALVAESEVQVQVSGEIHPYIRPGLLGN